MKKIQAILLPAVVAGVATILTSGIARADVQFVSNNGSNSIEEISGGVTSTFVATTSDLAGPTGLAVYNGILYVANNGSGDIAEFSATAPNDFLGDYVTGLSNPRGIVFDPAGNLYVANQSSGTIVEIPTGSPLDSTGTVIASGVSFNYPNGLAFYGGDLYVASGGNNQIDKVAFSGSSATISTFASGLSNPNGLGFYGATLFEMDNGSNTINEFNLSGGLIGTISDGNINNSKGLTLDSLGDVYVTDEGDNSVTEYGPNGKLVAVYSTGFTGPNYITNMASVPEPSTYALVATALGLIFFMRRRKTVTVGLV